MAKSGTFKNYICGNSSRPGYTLRTYWSSTPDVANNRSRVLCDHYLDCGSGWDLYIGTRSGTSNVGGDVKDFTKDGISQGTGGGSHKLGTTEHWIPHNDDGTKTVTATTTFNFAATISGTYYENIVATGTMVLDDIPRASTATVDNGTLGVAQAFKVTRNEDSFSHAITFSCGTVTNNQAVAKTTDLNPKWTPPPSLASQNKTGSKVTVNFTITTYDADGNSVGTNTFSAEYTIPTTVKPTAALTVTDGKGHLSTYGGYIQIVSTFKVNVTGTPIYGAAITSYSTKINGGSPYIEQSFETEPITEAGTYNIVASVTDARGNTGTATESVTVLEYYKPKLTISATRCDDNFEDNVEGTNIRVDMDYNVAPLNNKNRFGITVKWRKSGDTNEYYHADLEGNYQDWYNTTGMSFMIGEADSDSSYEIEVHITDNFNTSIRSTKVGSAFTFFHFDGPTKSGVGKNKLNVIEASDSGGVIGTDYLFENYTYTLLKDRAFANTYYEIPEAMNLPAGSIIRFNTVILDAGGEVRLYAAYVDPSDSTETITHNIATLSYIDGGSDSYFEYTVSDGILALLVEFTYSGSQYIDVRFRRPILTINEDDMTYESYIVGVPARLGVGKIAELDNGADFGLKARFNAGFEFPILRQYTDFDTLLTPNFYIGANVADYQYVNCPITGGTFYLEIVAAGEDSYRQSVTTCSKEASVTYERFYHDGSWGPWRDCYHGQEVLYDNESGSNGTITLGKLVTNFAFLDIYYTDNNGKYGGCMKITNTGSKTLCFAIVEDGPSRSWIRRTSYVLSNYALTPTVTNAGYVKLDGTSVSHDTGTNYIKITKVMGIR